MFPATVMIPQNTRDSDDPFERGLVKGKNFFEIAVPGAHCEAGGHYTSNSDDQEISLFAMAELAKRMGVEWRSDPEKLDPQLKEFYYNPYLRLMDGDVVWVDGKAVPRTIINAGAATPRFYDDCGEGTRKAFEEAVVGSRWRILTPGEVDVILGKGIDALSPAGIGVQIQNRPSDAYSQGAAWLAGSPGDQHKERALPGYSYLTAVLKDVKDANGANFFSDARLRNLEIVLFWKLDAKRSRSDGQEGFEP